MKNIKIKLKLVWMALYYHKDWVTYFIRLTSKNDNSDKAYVDIFWKSVFKNELVYSKTNLSIFRILSRLHAWHISCSKTILTNFNLLRQVYQVEMLAHQIKVFNFSIVMATKWLLWIAKFHQLVAPSKMDHSEIPNWLLTIRLCIWFSSLPNYLKFLIKINLVYIQWEK